MSATGQKVQSIIIWSIMLGGVLALGYVLYFVTDPPSRMRVGMFLLAPIVIPLLWAPHRFPVLSSVRNRPRRRFTVLRRLVRELLRDVSRLNWLILDAERGFDTSDETQEEIGAIEVRLLTGLERIKKAAGKPDKHPEEGHATDRALRKDPLPRWSPDDPDELD